MKYIIVDLEATCWETKGKQNEIIEIGAVCINENKEEDSRFCAFVKPKLHPELSEFCMRLTTIQQSDVDTAETFDVVVEKFKDWIHINESFVLCSWGFYDKSQFKHDCELHGLTTDWLKHHISLKHQHGEFNRLRRPVGMKEALKMEGLKLTGTHHRGIDDAVNISKIFVQCFDQWKFK